MNGWTVLMSALLLNALRRLRVAQSQSLMVESTEVPESKHLLGSAGIDRFARLRETSPLRASRGRPFGRDDVLVREACSAL